MKTYILTVLLLLGHATAGLCNNTTSSPLVLRASGDNNYPPYEYLDENDVPSGFNVDIFQAVSRVMGLESTIELHPWNEAREKLENGDIDLLMGMYFSPERDSLVDFSQPHLTINHSLFVRTDSPVKSLDDLRGREVIVQNGDIMHDYLINNDVETTIITSESQVDGLRMLARGKHDAFLGVKLQGLITLNRFHLKNIQTVGDPILPRQYCFAVAEGNTELLEILNEGLAIIDKTGDYREIYARWFGIAQPANVTFRRVIKYTAIAILPVFAVLLGMALWNRMLRDKVASRTRELRHELSVRKKAEAALRESEEQYRTLFETNRDALGFATAAGFILDVNKAWLELFGYERDEVIGRHVDFLYDDPRDRSLLDEAMKNDSAVRDLELRYRNKKDELLICLLTANARRDKNNDILYYQTSTRDITRQRELERQFIQAQKMESIGRLAGGIAHDFNNMLAVIMGNAELAIDELPKNSPVLGEIIEISETSQRAADLVSQLLAFSRKQVVEPRIVSLNTVLTDMDRMLRRLIGEKIDMVDIQTPDLWDVMADVSQLQQVVTNLVVNARDAMPEGGRITITTVNVSFDEHRVPEGTDLKPGEYVRLSVRDSGVGIDPEHLPKIFEPFFTTKQIEQGTGLGLSTCYGIAHQNGGTITVRSTINIGSVFNVFLPRHAGEDKREKSASAADDSGHAQSSAKVLVVEDDEAVRKMIRQILSRFEFTVETAANAEEALEIVNGKQQAFDLLITDVIMPGMNGNELANHLNDMYPELKTLMISGYTDEHVKSDDIVGHNIGFMHKPFRPSELITHVRRIINETN